PDFTLYSKNISDVGEYPLLFENKRIIRQSSSAKNATQLKSFLQGLGFSDEANGVKNDTKVASHFGYLKLDIQMCTRFIHEENREKNISLDEPYALVALPYIYNKKSDAYEVLLLSEHASISLMPKRLVEYGVFFDGTKNSMYNVDFNLDFHKYLNAQKDIVLDENAEVLPIDPSQEHVIALYPNAATYIREVDKPDKSKVINAIRDEIQERVRYFQTVSQDKINDKETMYKEYFQDRASNHADKVFDFLVDIKSGKLDKEVQKALEDQLILAQDQEEYKESLVKKYIYDEILPEGEGSSFVNGYTNIKRLFEHYKGFDPLNLKESEPRKYTKDRFKVYASGDGCVDPYESKALESDSKIGLGLAFGETGVLAHIVYTCDKIAKNLRESGNHQVDELVLDVFGFSRGAAEARHFVSSIMKQYEVLSSTTRSYTLDTSDSSKNLFEPFYPKEDGVYTIISNKVYFNPFRTDIEKITISKGSGKNRHTVNYYNPYFKKYVKDIFIDSISFRFIGIYDTVAHYGICQANDNEDLNLDFQEEKLGRLVHLIAEDEYRKNFALTHINENAAKKFQTKAKMKEIHLPGAHADVGGGYMDKEDNPRYIAKRDEKLLLTWNKKHEWIAQEEAIEVKIVSDIKEMKRYKKSGFYKIECFFSADELYMYRPHISNRYEYVCLKLMHDEARNTEEVSEKVPLDDIVVAYKIDAQKEEDMLLHQVYKELKEDRFMMHGVLHKTLRQSYLHHSSDLNGIAPIDVNAPSMESYNKNSEIYGKRVKYSATKKQSCYRL
ncbi:MAG: DUF2235 domain-containing protein, partial [Sulfurimonas sp.]|uniref:phospholipase effector Tle1 domain-containing protein n=1 Tax=Sulfurimonas sp. TaxID=2022749 RepID=UPI003D12E95E